MFSKKNEVLCLSKLKKCIEVSDMEISFEQTKVWGNKEVRKQFPK